MIPLLLISLLVSFLLEFLISYRCIINLKYHEKNTKSKLIRILYYFGIVITSYISMFLLMSLSIWIFISLILGHFIGNYIFNFAFINFKKEYKIIQEDENKSNNDEIKQSLL